MTSRRAVVTAVLALILAVGAGWRLMSVPTGPVSSTEKPNLILITIDALRADHLGAYGYARDTSPAMDRFARSAIVITDAISQAPYTKASMASLLTGLLPSAHKTYTTANIPMPTLMRGGVGGISLPTTDVLPPSLPILPEELRRAGYETFAFTTNPFLIPDFGFSRGFDHFRFFDGETFAAADKVLGDAFSAIGGARTRPFFAWIHLMEPHSPYAPPAAMRALLPPLTPPRPIPSSFPVPPYLIDEQTRDLRVYEALYDAEIRTVDAAVGHFLDRIRSTALWDRTAMVITADHGEEFMEHGGLEHNRTLYDEMVRVPMLIRVPGLLPRRLATEMQLIDLFPTLVALAGGEQPRDVFGNDMLPVLAGTRSGDGYAVSELVGHATSLRTMKWKLIETVDGTRELYALDTDRVEQRDLAAHADAQVTALAGILHGVNARAVARGRTIERGQTAVRPSVLDRLRSLGYVGDVGDGGR